LCSYNHIREKQPHLKNISHFIRVIDTLMEDVGRVITDEQYKKKIIPYGEL